MTRPVLAVLLLSVSVSAQTLLYETGPTLLSQQVYTAYGASAAALDDVDGDGVPDYVVGRPGFPDATAGGFSVHSGADGAPIVELQFSDFTGDDFHVARSLTSIGDVDGDGARDIVAGSPGFVLGSLFDPGSVRIYSSADGSLLDVWQGGDKELFGHDVVNVGDVDGDGVEDVVVGAPAADFVDLRSGGDGALIARVDGPADSRFGWAVVSVGDLVGDARPEVAVASRSGVVERLDVVSFDGTFLWGRDGIDGDFDVADLDGDGQLELLAAADGDVLVLDAATGAPLSVVEAPPAVSLGRAVTNIGDVDGDGGDEVVVGLEINGIWLRSSGDGSLAFRATASLAGVHRAVVVRLGDVDGDGRADFGVSATGANSWGGGQASITGRSRFSVFTSRDVPIAPVDSEPVGGVAGDPVLRASGTPAVGQTVTVELFSAAPSSPVFVVIGDGKVAPTPTPSGLTVIAGGVLVPSPDVVLVAHTDALGRWQGTAPWPRLDTGSLTYVQAWIADASAPQGFAVSDAVQLTTAAP